MNIGKAVQNIFMRGFSKKWSKQPYISVLIADSPYADALYDFINSPISQKSFIVPITSILAEEIKIPKTFVKLPLGKSD